MRSSVYQCCIAVALLIGSSAGKAVEDRLSADASASADLSVQTKELSVDANGQSSARDEKLFSVFQIIQFNNGMCNATSGEMGVCFTAAECTSKGGVSSGSCASGFGVCCVFTLNTCGGEVSQLVSYIESPNYPSAAPAGMCMYTLPRCDTGICQYRVMFEDVMLSPPDMGSCTNDTLTFSGIDAVSVNTVPNPVCGTLSGQEIILSANETSSLPKFTFNVASVASNSRWRIKVVQVPCTDPRLAPPGCLTYNQGTSGTFSSLNNQNGNGESITGMNCYSHCVEYQQGFCDMALTASSFDLATGDTVGFGTSVFTGTAFGTAGSLLYNFTGPYTIPVCLTNSNTGMNSGYNINYMLLPC